MILMYLSPPYDRIGVRCATKGKQTCKDEHKEVAEEDDGVGGVAEVAPVLPELLDGGTEVAELDPLPHLSQLSLPELPELSLPLEVGEAQVEAQREVGHSVRGHHW